MVDAPRTQKKVVRQGNSLTLRPPATYLSQLGLSEGSPVTFILEPGRIVVEPATEAAPPHVVPARIQPRLLLDRTVAR